MSNRVTVTHALLGQVKILQATYTDASGAPYDPSSVGLTIKAPDGTITTVDPTNITKVATGVYQYILIPDSSGQWAARWTTPDTFPEPGEIVLQVDRSAVLDV